VAVLSEPNYRLLFNQLAPPVREAIAAASECAEAAQAYSRETDHQFWLAVLANLRGNVS
jgi:hypothetical protein